MRTSIIIFILLVGCETDPFVGTAHVQGFIVSQTETRFDFHIVYVVDDRGEPLKLNNIGVLPLGAIGRGAAYVDNAHAREKLIDFLLYQNPKQAFKSLIEHYKTDGLPLGGQIFTETIINKQSNETRNKNK